MKEKINTIGLSKFNAAEHISFHNSVSGYLKTCTPEKISATELTAPYAAAIYAEQELVKRQEGSALTPQLEAADAERDHLLTYFFSLFDTAALSPVAVQKSAHAALLPIIKPYRGIQTDALKQETSEISGLLFDLDRDELVDSLTALNLTDPLALISAANSAYIALDQQRTALMPTAAESNAARAQTDGLYQQIVDKANATAILAPVAENVPAVDTFVQNVNNLIRQMQNGYNTRIGIARAAKEKKAAEKAAEAAQQAAQ